MHLPARPDEITPEWLDAVLRASADDPDTIPTVEAVAHERIGTGQLATTHLVTPTYAGRAPAAPARLVAKLPATDPGVREYARSLGAYAREVRFYRDVADSLAVRTPSCFHAEVADDGIDFCLLLEDLSPAVECGQIEGCDRDRAALVLDQAAALHAGSWRRPADRELSWLSGGLGVWQHLGASMPEAQAAFRSRYADVLDDATGEVARLLADDATARWVDRLREPRCLWHGDFRLDNLMFSARGGEVPLAVVDWQSVTLAAGVVDAAYFVGGSIPTELRREVEEDLVRGYHRSLVERGVRDYSWDECWREYRLNALAGFVVAVAASAGAERTERGDRMFTTMASRAAAHVLDHGSVALLED